MKIAKLKKDDLRSLYAAEQPQQIACTTGLLGFFTLTWTANRTLNSIWTDRFIAFKRSGFTKEVYTFIDEFVHSGSYSNCDLYAESHNYSYVIHCNWNGSAMVYVYIKQWLIRHILASQNGIRFLEPINYREVFRLTDGTKISITNEFGRNIYICRFVDPTHLQVGQSMYHINDFACDVMRYCKVCAIA